MHLERSEIEAIVDQLATRLAPALRSRLRDDEPEAVAGKVLVNKPTAAKILGGISEASVDRLRKQGLPYVMAGGLVMFRPEALAEWAKKQEQGGK